MVWVRLCSVGGGRQLFGLPQRWLFVWDDHVALSVDTEKLTGGCNGTVDLWTVDLLSLIHI